MTPRGVAAQDRRFAGVANCLEGMGQSQDSEIPPFGV